MINRFFVSDFTVKRQVWEDNKSTLVSNGSFCGNIQQATDNEYSESLGLKFTKTFKVWCPVDTDVKEGDRLNDEYDVKFVVTRSMGTHKHLLLILEKL